MAAFKIGYGSDFLQPNRLPAPFPQRIAPGLAHGAQDAVEIPLHPGTKKQRLLPDVAGILETVSAAPVVNLLEKAGGVKIADGVEVIAADLLRFVSNVVSQGGKQRLKVVAGFAAESLKEPRRPGDGSSVAAFVIGKGRWESVAEVFAVAAKQLLVIDLDELPNCLGIHQVDRAAVRRFRRPELIGHNQPLTSGRVPGENISIRGEGQSTQCFAVEPAGC